MIKKLISLFLVLAALFCTVPMRSDTPPEKQKEIPLKHVLSRPPVRNLEVLTLQAYYNCMLNSIQTIVTMNLGSIEMTVTNLTTGETWSDTFNSAISPYLLPISGSPGLYEITYFTSFGDLYEGTFIIE